MSWLAHAGARITVPSRGASSNAEAAARAHRPAERRIPMETRHELVAGVADGARLRFTQREPSLRAPGRARDGGGALVVDVPDVGVSIALAFEDPRLRLGVGVERA